MKYVLIDNASGYVWGSAYADNPIMACRLVDEGCGESGREYDECTCPASANECGYWVHAAPDGYRINNGQDRAEIADADALPFVTYVRVCGA